EIGAMYRDNQATVNLQSGSTFSPNFGADLNQTAVMANFFYDFLAGQTIVPYIGAGLGVAFINTSALGSASSSTQFAYQGMIGVGWNVNEQFRVNLEGRYYGTTSPWFSCRAATSSSTAPSPTTTSASSRAFSTSLAPRLSRRRRRRRPWRRRRSWCSSIGIARTCPPRR